MPHEPTLPERLREIPAWMVGKMTPGWQEHGTTAYHAADYIERLEAELRHATEAKGMNGGIEHGKG